MRTLEKTKIKLWVVDVLGVVDELDSDGFYTGHKIKQYSEPRLVKMSLYPSNGSIVQNIFGTECNFDKIGVSTDVVLNEDSLLFLSEPTGNYATTYDYKVVNIKSSFNIHNYGLARRV